MRTVEIERIPVGNVELNTAIAGTGRPVVLLHGWPHTWLLWRDVMSLLAADHRVIVPDLRGLGESSRAADGYDLETLAADLDGLLDALDVTDALVAGIDVGAPVAWMLAQRYSRRVRRLAVMEAVLGELPGADAFFAGGPPWWFGFHAVDGLAESVLVGHEDGYIGWFLEAGTVTTLDPELRREFVASYSGTESLRCGFQYYRQNALNAKQIDAVLAGPDRVDVPTLAIAGGVVGHALAGQLQKFTPDLQTLDMTHCGHIIPVDDAPGLAAALTEFDS
jgi:pimeloyl-ACP methyl ester carboxylesterase